MSSDPATTESFKVFLAKEYLKQGPSAPENGYNVWEKDDIRRRILLDGPDIETSKVIEITNVKYREVGEPFANPGQKDEVNNVPVNIVSQIEISALNIKQGEPKMIEGPIEERYHAQQEAQIFVAEKYILQEVTDGNGTSLVLVTPEGNKTVVEVAPFGKLRVGDSEGDKLNIMHAKCLIDELANLTIKSREEKSKVLRTVTKPYEVQGIQVEVVNGIIKLQNPGNIEPNNLKELNNALQDPIYAVKQGYILRDWLKYEGEDAGKDFIERLKIALESAATSQIMEDLILVDDQNDSQRQDRIRDITKDAIDAMSGLYVTENGQEKMQTGLTNLLQTFGLKTTRNIVESIKFSTTTTVQA